MAKIPLFKDKKKTILPLRTGWAYNKLIKAVNTAKRDLRNAESHVKGHHETICHKNTQIDNLQEEKGRLATAHKNAQAKLNTKIQLLENNAETATSELAKGSKQIAHLTAQLEKHNKPVSKKRAKKKS